GNDIIVDESVPILDQANQESLAFEFPEIELIPNQSYYLHYLHDEEIKMYFSGAKLSKGNEEDPAVLLEGSFIGNNSELEPSASAFQVENNIWVNHFELLDFQQEFQPSSVVIKVSILEDRDERNPLAEAERTIHFTEPGAR